MCQPLGQLVILVNLIATHRAPAAARWQVHRRWSHSSRVQQLLPVPTGLAALLGNLATLALTSLGHLPPACLLLTNVYHYTAEGNRSAFAYIAVKALTIAKVG